MAVGTRIYVHGEGHGTYAGFTGRWIGANEHTIKFDSGETKTLKLIIKADTQGSVEAIVDTINKIESDKVQSEIVHSGVGSISESDAALASAFRPLLQQVLGESGESLAAWKLALQKAVGVNGRLLHKFFQVVEAHEWKMYQLVFFAYCGKVIFGCSQSFMPQGF